MGDFPGGPVVKPLPSNAGGMGSIPGQGAKIPYASRPKNQKKIFKNIKRKKKESCTTMFIAALFTIARTWKQPMCPSTVEWIKKMWHIYTMEYYSAIKGNEIDLFVVRWMDLESVIQSEVTQKEKNKYRMLAHIYGI